MKKNILAITTIGMLLLSSFAIVPAFGDTNEPSNLTTHYVDGKENKQQPELTLTNEYTPSKAIMKAGGEDTSQRGEIIVWDNGMDYDAFLPAMWDETYEPPFDAYPADDFEFEKEGTAVNDVHWIGAYYYDGYQSGDFDWNITFYYDRGDGEAPGEIYKGPYTYAQDECNPVLLKDTGSAIFYEFFVYLPENIMFDTSKYWISIWGVGTFPPQSYWGCNQVITGHQAVFKSEYFGYYDWTNTEEFFGNAYDMCFQLTFTEPCSIDVEKQVLIPFDFPCDYTICLEDTYGDGWNGGTIDVFVNGDLLYDDLTLETGSGPECHPITVNASDVITVDYTNGSYYGENYYYIRDCDGNVVADAWGESPHDPEPEITVTVSVGTWVDADDPDSAVDVEIYTNVTFRIAIHNDGMCDLLDVWAYDFMEDSLEFVDADLYPTTIVTVPGGTWLNWTGLGDLSHCEWIYITVNATVVGPAYETDENNASADAWCPCEEMWVYDEDSAFVHAIPPNNPPNKPSDPNPINEADNVGLDPTISVYVSDPDGDTINVSFWGYRGSNEEHVKLIYIGTNTDVLSGTTSQITWNELDYNTTYYWYAIANDSEYTNRSDTWRFTTMEAPSNDPPVADFTHSINDLTVTFDATNSSDPDGTIIAWNWTFGDGTTGNGTIVEHNYTKEQPIYTVELTVTDDGGKTGSISKGIVVVNNPPVANFTYTIVGKTVTFDASSSSDENGTIVSYHWDFDDGTNETVINPKHVYAEDYRTYNVTLTVNDSAGASSSLSKDVTISDGTPPKVDILKPVKKGVYIRNDYKISRIIGMPLIIGDITIKVNASDEGSEIDYVEFYAGLLGNKYLGNDTTEPYSFDWKKDRIRFLHIHLLTVKAYDKAGNMAEAKMIVRKLL